MQLARINQKYSRLMMQQRKQETRRKIQLGGLIVKADLQDESTAVLYGLLLEAAELLTCAAATETRQRWQIRGDIALTLSQDNN
jgi:Conjugal transfer protein TraD